MSRPGSATTRKPPPHELDRRWIAGLFAIHAAVSALDLLFGGATALSEPERAGARAALLLACGHSEGLSALPSGICCGQRGLSALSGAPLLSLFGEGALAWRLAPLASQGLVLGLGAALTARASPFKAQAAAAWLLLTLGGLGGPLRWSTWSNPSELLLFPLLSALLLSLSGASGRLQTPLLALAGLSCGLGMGYASLCWALSPALLVAAGLGEPRRLKLFVAAMPLGFPLAALHGYGALGSLSAAGALGLAPIAELGGWLWGAWRGPAEGLLGGVSALRAALLCGLALAGGIFAAREAGQSWGVDRGAALFAPVSLAGLVAVAGLFYPLWQPGGPGEAAAFAQAVPALSAALLAATAALSAGWSGRSAPVIGVALLLCGGLGLVERAAHWGGASPSDLRLSLEPGAPDPTVPGGEPPLRDPQALSRPQDLAAANSFLEEHADPLPGCRLDHLSEWGRRAGLALAADLAPGPPPTVEGACEARAVAEGIALGLTRSASSIGMEERLRGLPPELSEEAGRAVGRRLARSLGAAGVERAALSGALAVGVCEERGERWLRAPTSPPPTCAGWERGAARAWAHLHGCSPGAQADLSALAPNSAQAAAEICACLRAD